ncbi:hypothetical protein [Thermocrinis sp.]|uniref:hypothetical protein n=1 Tax=Thermocrinis sp. TaxID=2024383 RepID=UPI003C0289C7
MAKAIDLELLQLLEDKLGKGTARKVAQLEKRGRRTCHPEKSLNLEMNLQRNWQVRQTSKS